jgi:ABC-2 type transport system ATP-binding protein
MNHVIEMQQLSFSYGKKHALKNIRIQMNENQLIGLIGRNGSGKTTMMKLCAGLLVPKSGEIKVFGQNPVNNLSVLNEVIYSYTKVPFKAPLTLERIITDFGRFYEHFDMVFAYKLMDYFSLNHRAKYSSLSQGMCSLVSFICAISTRAKLTLLDEPVIGMDITIRHMVYEILLRDYMEYPRTIIISSHILSEIQDLLSEMIIIDNGAVLLYKALDELQTMAYRIEGGREEVETFLTNRTVLYKEHKVTGSLAVLEASFDAAADKECKQLNLSLSKVTPEELYIYKTNDRKEMDIECLWEKQI